MMKAVIWPRYGPPEVLRIQAVDRPVPGNGEVLVRVIAATVFAGDCEMRGCDFPASFWLVLRLMFGLTKPRKQVQIPGQEFAGIVEVVGAGVTEFKKGDPVFGPAEKFGAHAEYLCVSDKNVMASKPVNMSFEEAATVPVGGLNALHFVRKGRVGDGDAVLINGAAGSIGTFAVQIARTLGAEVTAVDSTEKLAMLRDIGANHVIDYTQEDFTKAGKSYDVIIDVVGKSPYAASVRSLKENGRYILGNPRFSGFLRGLWTTATSDRQVIAALTGYQNDDLVFLKALIEAGNVRTVIDRRFALEHIVDAHRYVESGRKCGHVVINVSQER